MWQYLNSEEFPENEMYVWVTDGKTVRPATFYWEYPENEEDRSEPFKNAEWRDENGKLLKGIKAWMFQEDSPENPPPLPEKYQQRTAWLGQ
jgi:hypothetical protein